MRLRKQARSVCGKSSVTANAEMNEMNEKDGKSFSSGEEDENALLAEDGNDHDTTGVHAIAPNKLWEYIQGLQKKVDLLAGTSKCITDASLKRKVPQTSKAESKSDSNSQPGPSKKKARKTLSNFNVASDDSDSDEKRQITRLATRKCPTDDCESHHCACRGNRENK